MTKIYWFIWLVLMIAMSAFAIAVSVLIVRLREIYPVLYESIGKPRVVSRKTEFLWRLRHKQSDLSKKDRMLFRLCVALLVATWILFILSIACAVRIGLG